MDYSYARPPPPQLLSMADPNYLQQPPQQPVPPPAPWFPGQFQYHPSQHSPSPPPQWPPPPPPQQHSDHLPPPPYHAPPRPPYVANPMQQYHTYPYSLPPRAPMPPPHSQVPQPYPPVNQDWSNQSWGHQGWDYSVRSNEDDWAAKAKAWAADKAVSEAQHQQPQFMPVGRPEERNHYHDHYTQNVDPHYTDVQQQSSSYSHYPPPIGPTHRTHMMQDTSSSSSFSSGYASDGHLPPYPARDGNLGGDSAAAGFPHHQGPSPPTSLSVHQQEVPSSYSSVAGNEEVQEQNGKFYQPSHMPFTSAPQHQVPPMSNIGRPVLMEQPHYAYGNQSTDPRIDLSDQPLEFTPRFNREHDPVLQSSYTNESGVPAMPSNYSSWAPSTGPGEVYSSIPQASVPPLYHPTTTFPGETYGASGVPQHAKKALPNWLREEVIKKKAAIGSSVPELSKEHTKSDEDEGIDNSLGKGDQSDGKSVESSRSIEDDDDDDEDYVEAARTAAINKEIKRVLTEVLLKVTDELFDEIAMKVLTEDSLSVEVEHNNVASNHTIAPSTPGISTPKASAKVLIPLKSEGTEVNGVTGKSIASSTGDLLGLGDYASDDDDDEEEVHDDAKPSPKESIVHHQPAGHKLTEATKLEDNGSLQADINERSQNVLDKESGPHTISPTVDRDDTKSEKVVDGSEVSNSKGFDKVDSKTTLPKESSNIKKLVTDDSEGKTAKDGSGNSYSDRSSSGNKSKEIERISRKGDEHSRSQEERHKKGQIKDDRNGSKGKIKHQEEKAKESDPRNRSHVDVREDKKETERDRRASTKEDNDRSRERERAKDEKGERSRHKLASDSSRHKRQRSSSSDESSDGSRRKVHSKRNSSLSPVRSRRRHVSRSPHSKHSQRRHSPYSSLESTRKRRSRSRSRSPARRQK